MSRFASRLTVAFGVCTFASCTSTFPTQDDIEAELDRELSSVTGSWSGAGTQSAVTVTFQLDQSGTAVQGSGTFQETPASAVLPITVTGTFERPTLSLSLSAFEIAGATVTGTLSGDYVTVAGLFTTIQITGGPGGAIPILLQETTG
jgi:hypothetical protein